MRNKNNFWYDRAVEIEASSLPLFDRKEWMENARGTRPSYADNVKLPGTQNSTEVYKNSYTSSLTDDQQRMFIH